MAGSARGRTRNRRAWRQTISSANLYDRRRGFAATVRRKSFSSKEKQIWVRREKKIKAKGKNRKRPSVIQRKNENWKKKRKNKCPVLFGDLKSSTEVVCQLLEETIQTVANGGLTLHTLMQSRPPFDLHQDLVVGSSEPRLWIKGCNSQLCHLTCTCQLTGTIRLYGWSKPREKIAFKKEDHQSRYLLACVWLRLFPWQCFGIRWRDS